MFGIYLNHVLTAEEQRRLVFQGEFLLMSKFPESVALCKYAESCMETAFGDLDPLTAQQDLSVEDFISRVSPLKTHFTNHQETKDMLQSLLIRLGYDPERTYFDVPRLRVVPSDNYLSAGVSYEYKPHRDLWYSSPQAQVNFWMPVHTITPASAMSMYPAYWGQAVENSSHTFDYDYWQNHERQKAESLTTVDNRNHPLPMEKIDPKAEMRIAGTQGDLLIFSPAHLHGTAPNDSGHTRYSIDFRAICIDDMLDRHGAPNVDTQAKGSTLRDFIRVSDLAPLDLGGVAQHVE